MTAITPRVPPVHHAPAVLDPTVGAGPSTTTDERLVRATAHQPIPLSRIVSVELRKSFDTRSGFWLMASIGIASLLATIGVILFAAAEERTFSTFTLATGFPMAIILPVIAILSVTSEWSQRTGLTTFTLVPHRGRVILAKGLAVVLVAIASMLLAFAIGAAGNVVGALIAGTDAIWDQSIAVLGAIVLGNTLVLLVGFSVNGSVMTGQASSTPRRGRRSPVRVRRRRHDAVDHRGGERDFILDEAAEIGVARARRSATTTLRDGAAVRRKVVAAQHREGRDGPHRAGAPQRLDEKARRGARLARVREVGDDVGMVLAQGARRRIVAIALLGDGQADDAHVRIGHAVEQAPRDLPARRGARATAPMTRSALARRRSAPRGCRARPAAAARRTCRASADSRRRSPSRFHPPRARSST